MPSVRRAAQHWQSRKVVERHDQVDFEDFAKEAGRGTSKNDGWLKYPRLEPAGSCISRRVYEIGVQTAHAGLPRICRAGNTILVRR
jgi:hypothetical protein